MRIVQLILIGVLAISSMAIAVGVFVVGGTLIKQGDEVSEQNDLLADIHSELSIQTKDAAMLSVMNRWAICDLVGVTADNEGNSANDDFYDERPWCYQGGLDPWVEAWDLTETEEVARYGWGSADGQ